MQLISQFRFYAVVGALAFALSACDKETKVVKDADSSDATEAQITETVTAQESILDEGFYQQQPDEQKALTTKEKPSAPDESPPAIDSVSSASNSSAETMLQDLGFSGAVEPLEPESEPTNPSYCVTDSVSVDFNTEEECKRISKRLASVQYPQCQNANLKPSGCSSVNGFPILISEFAPLESREPQGRILVIGGTHGDELTSVSVTFRWIDKLRKHHSGLFHWHIAPMMNPDGVLKREASRTNTNGVDLNRNMPSEDWQENAIKYWEIKTGKDPRKNPGLEAASEPESQWIVDEINAFQPDAIISVHAPYGVVDFDSLLLNVAPKSLGKLHLNFLGTYPGSLGNYAGMNRNIPVITLELPHAWEMPSEKETTKIWEDIVSWLKKNVNVERTAQN